MMTQTTRRPKRQAGSRHSVGKNSAQKRRSNQKKRTTSGPQRRSRTSPRQTRQYGGSLDNKLRIIPLGGCEEVGRNMTVFEYNRDIVVLDMGLQFPEEDMPGIDYIVPNTKYLENRKKDIKGVIFSHGHLDHIGAAPILLEKLGINAHL